MRYITLLNHLSEELRLIREEMKEKGYPLWPFKRNKDGTDSPYPNSTGRLRAANIILDLEEIIKDEELTF